MMKKIIIPLVAIGIVILGCTLGAIRFYAKTNVVEPIDTLIVLGAKINEDTPSLSLEYRLERALEEYKKNPELQIIVSGAQGVDEDYTEAFIMKKYLVEHGVLEDNILMEERATSTQENIEYSFKLIGDDQHVGIVSNDYHLLRSKIIANRLGKEVSLLAARTPKVTMIKMNIREVLALFKTILLG